MKYKLIGGIAILSYPLSMYGFRGVEEWIGWLSMLLPFVAALVWGVLSIVLGWLFGKGKIEDSTVLYISFVLSVLSLILLHHETDFIIGRMIMWLGGTLLYLSRLIEDREKRDKEVQAKFYYDLKSGKVGIREGYVL